ncbi:polysaccharide pyruvyl transferase family protein [Segatella copri]|uniref:polysaccharide pyruvyl transferase family protein n=1 Tax=Segatella copri TaxID=165179 RepID=UPI001C45C471|nr:polysaccharide pyruvyl transferase family protein [Segatella copri]MBW0049986.1 polysaccharide pyruvyl transferase family protein [Segatella copri]
MKSIGIITIHKINNYGSVLQAYALQKVCEDLGYEVEIIDYDFPNNFHQNNKYANVSDTQPNEPKLIKALFAKSLIKQHKGISSFVKKYLNLSDKKYHQVEDFTANPPSYDVYITGSDQLWSPRHCNGDPAFMLYFAPDNALKISYAASIGSNAIPEELKKAYIELLSRYKHISVRENTGADVIRSLIGRDATVVLDPTLLLNKDEWNKIATPKRLVRKKYILCYFLNYTFNAFPYVDELAKDIQKQTGYEIVRVARPPHKLSVGNTTYKIDASPEDFLALIRDAEIVLTTSFHGTAFAVNYAKPVFTVVQDRNASDSRQVSLMLNLGLDKQVLSVKDEYPTVSDANYNVEKEQAVLNQLRLDSKLYLEKALKDE